MRTSRPRPTTRSSSISTCRTKTASRSCAGCAARGEATPVLIAHRARRDQPTSVAGLDAGADDYLRKPFAFIELEARLRSLARRPPGWSGDVLEASAIFLRLQRRAKRARGDATWPLPRKKRSFSKCCCATAAAPCRAACSKTCSGIARATAPPTCSTSTRAGLRNKLVSNGRTAVARTRCAAWAIDWIRRERPRPAWRVPLRSRSSRRCALFATLSIVGARSRAALRASTRAFSRWRKRWPPRSTFTTDELSRRRGRPSANSESLHAGRSVCDRGRRRRASSPANRRLLRSTGGLRIATRRRFMRNGANVRIRRRLAAGRLDSRFRP